MYTPIFCKVNINFNGNIDVIKEFVNRTTGFSDIMLWSNDGRFRVDAHSLMGIFSLDTSKELKLIYPETEKEEIINTFKEWIVCE